MLDSWWYPLSSRNRYERGSSCRTQISRGGPLGLQPGLSSCPVLYSLISHSVSKKPLPSSRSATNSTAIDYTLSYQRPKETSPLPYFCQVLAYGTKKCNKKGAPPAFWLPSPRPPSCAAILPSVLAVSRRYFSGLLDVPQPSWHLVYAVNTPSLLLRCLPSH